jgi:hypothetical protein
VALLLALRRRSIARSAASGRQFSLDGLVGYDVHGKTVDSSAQVVSAR